MPPEAVEVAALGLVQGAAELLPVSSSAHVAALPWLLRWDVAGWPPARRKELEVALHAGAALALAPELLRALPDARTLALSLAPPVILGYALERPIEEHLGGPGPLAAGLTLGAAALAAADAAAGRKAARPAVPARGGRRAARAAGRRAAARSGARLPLALGAAQAAALLPGVSRTGATLAAARALGLSRGEASRVSFGVAGPVLAGATALKAWRARRGAEWPLVATGAAAAFAGTRLALTALGLERTRPWWPYAAERAVLAGAILIVRYRRAR